MTSHEIAAQITERLLSKPLFEEEKQRSNSQAHTADAVSPNSNLNPSPSIIMPEGNPTEIFEDHFKADFDNSKPLNILSPSLIQRYRGFLKETKNIKILNCIGYGVTAICLFLTALLVDKNLFILNDPYVDIPIHVYGMAACWSVVLSVQGIFAVLPMCYETEKFNDLVIQRINYWYFLSTILFIIFIFFFSFGESGFPKGISAILICTVKLITLIALYKRIKYVDEGQYYVGYIEFVCLHLMNSVNNSWYTYLTLFEGCKFLRVFKVQTNQVIGILCVCIMLSEAAINLAYYKDAFFAGMACAILFGCFLISSNNSYVILGLTFTGFGFIILTILKHREKILYMSYSRKINFYIGNTQKMRESHYSAGSMFSSTDEGSSFLSFSSDISRLINAEEEAKNLKLSSPKRDSIIITKDYEISK